MLFQENQDVRNGPISFARLATLTGLNEQRTLCSGCLAGQDRSAIRLDQTTAAGLRGEVRTHVSGGVVHDGAHRCGVLPHYQVKPPECTRGFNLLGKICFLTTAGTEH